MANTILTPTAVTRKALQILHQKLNFVGSINRQYDDSYAKTGAKIGDSLKIRLPNEFTVRSGATLSAQDVSETSVTMQVATQKGVDMTFPTAELTTSIDDFASRFLEPAMAVLAANIEADALGMYKDVYNLIDGDAAAFAFGSTSDASTQLTKMLAPMSERTMLLTPDHANKLRKDTKGLFHSAENISKQYRDGVVGMTSGFSMYENTLLVPHTTGTAAKTTGYLVNGGSQSGATLTVDTGLTSFLIGDVITIANVFRVHPETKVSTGELQQFVVTANSGTSATSLAISPSIVTSGARQNVNAAPADNAAITKVGAGASETLTQSLAYHKNAFAFATVDLEDVSQYGAWGAREVYDGISMRIARQYAISSDTVPCRIDVLYGYKAIRPQLAVRVHNDG
jgi:hypothetical protein